MSTKKDSSWNSDTRTNIGLLLLDQASVSLSMEANYVCRSWGWKYLADCWVLTSDGCAVIGIKERVPFLTSASPAMSDYFISVRNACNFGVALLAFCARMNRFSLVNSHQVENHTHFLQIREIQGRVGSTSSLWILWGCHGWRVSVWGCVVSQKRVDCRL